MTLGILLGLAGFTLFLLLHGALFHWQVLKAEFKNLAALWVLSLLFAWSGCAVAGSLSFSPEVLGNPLVRGTTALLVFACCSVLYMPFYYTVAASLSVQTMILVHESGPEGCSLAFLENLFASKNVLHKRLEIMVANGYLVKHGSRFMVTAKGATISRAFFGLKNLWRLGAGG